MTIIIWIEPRVHSVQPICEPRRDRTKLLAAADDHLAVTGSPIAFRGLAELAA